MNAACPEHFTREMGITPAEFERTLGAAVAPYAYRRNNGSYTIDHPAGAIEIRLGPAGERRIAALVLPTMQVEFSFHGLSEAARHAFITRFDRYFHRGGG
jgi:hypothetical protein